MAADPKKVFVIHGRNRPAREQLGAFLRALGLMPVYFEEVRQTMGGAPAIADVIKVGMACAHGVVALFTADEVAAVRPEYRSASDSRGDSARWQARPNVIFEAGMAFARDRTRVVFVLLGNPALFTNVDGISVLRPTNDVQGDRSLLRGILISMGCAVDPDAVAWHSAGDFVSCLPPSREAPDPFRVNGSIRPTHLAILSVFAAALVGFALGSLARAEETDLKTVLDRRLGTDNWFRFPNRSDGVGVRRVPRNLRLNWPMASMDYRQSRFKSGETVPGGEGATIELEQPLRLGEVPAAQHLALVRWKVAEENAQALTARDVDSILGAGNWRCALEYKFAVKVQLSNPLAVEYPITAVDHFGSDKLVTKFGVGDQVPPGESTVWLAGGLPPEQCPGKAQGSEAQ